MKKGLKVVLCIIGVVLACMFWMYTIPIAIIVYVNRCISKRTGNILIGLAVLSGILLVCPYALVILVCIGIVIALAGIIRHKAVAH